MQVLLSSGNVAVVSCINVIDVEVYMAHVYRKVGKCIQGRQIGDLERAHDANAMN